MTKPREKTREELQAEIEDGKKKIRQFENREKMLRQKLSKEERRTRSHRMKFCVQRGLGALPSTSKRRGKSQRDFLLCGPVCINTGIACRYYP